MQLFLRIINKILVIIHLCKKSSFKSKRLFLEETHNGELFV